MGENIRQSARNLQKLATESSDDQNEDIYKRDYTLNMGKALKKKLSACDLEYKVKSSNRGGNQIFNFSAAMYELYRTNLVDHFEILHSNSTNMKIEYKDTTDKGNFCVESLIRVFDKHDATHMYTINLYHTKSKIMVNGIDVSSFNAEHSKITEAILASENVNLLEQELRTNIIEGLKSIEDTCTKYKSNKAVNVQSKPLTSLPDTTQTCNSNAVQCTSANVQLSNVQGILESNGDEQNVLCPMCDNGVEEGICCDLCQKWYHYQCESVSDDDIERFRDTDLQFMCNSCYYENQCQLLNDSIMFTQTGISEAGEETCPKTVDLSMHHRNAQTIVRSTARISDEPDRLTNLDVVGSNQRQGTCDKTEQSCISHEKSEPEVSNQSSVKGTDKSQNMGRSKSLQQQEISLNAGLDGHDATGKVTIGTPNDKVVDSQHQSTKPHKVQAKDIPKTKDPKEQQQNTCEVQKDIASAGTVLDQTQGNNSGGMADLQGGANRKAGKQNSKQTKKTEKSKLKEDEQEEQLKLARSLISNLERKVGELENSNRILRQDRTTSLSTDTRTNDIHAQAEYIGSSSGGDAILTGSPLNYGSHRGHTGLEKDLMGLMGDLIGLQREQTRARILSIEQSMNLQNQLNAVYSLGMTMNAPSDQPLSGAYRSFPRDNQMRHYTYPYNAYGFPYQGSPAVPPRHPNRNIPSQGAAPDPYRHSSHNYGPPLMSQASSAGFPPPYGLNNPSQFPQALNVGVPPPYGPNIPIYNPPHLPLAPNVGYPPYGPNIPICNPVQMPRAPNIGFPPYGPNNPNFTPTQTPQALNPCHLPPGGYPIFYQPHQRSSSVPQRTGQHQQGVQNRGSGNVGQHNHTQWGHNGTHQRGDGSYIQQQTASVCTNIDYIQTQKVTDDNGSTTSQTTVLNTQAEKDTTQTGESAPQVLVCSDADKSPQDSIDRQPQEETVTQNRQARAYEGDGTKEGDPLTLTPGQSNAGAATENNERRESEKPFLGAGRASEKTAKKQSL